MSQANVSTNLNDQEVEPIGRRSVRKNIYGNYVGYIGRRKWEIFGDNEFLANRWLEADPLSEPSKLKTGPEPSGRRSVRKNIFGRYIGYIGRQKWEDFGKNERLAEQWVKVEPPAEANSLSSYPVLGCPLCDRPRRPIRINGDGSVTYQTCPPDHEKHGSPYTFAIADDGTLLERGR